MQDNHTSPLKGWWKRTFKRKPKVSKGMYGVYKYTYYIGTLNEHSYEHKYNIFAKVIAEKVYEDMVELTLEKLELFESVDQTIIDMIKKNFPKFVDPKMINWEEVILN